MAAARLRGDDFFQDVEEPVLTCASGEPSLYKALGGGWQMDSPPADESRAEAR